MTRARGLGVKNQGPGGRRGITISYGLLFLPLILFFFPGHGMSDEKIREKAKVTFLQGKAEVHSQGATAWRLLKAGNLLSREDEVRTGEKSRLEIQLPDQSILRFDQRTTFQLQSVWFDPREGSRGVKVKMTAGKTWANVRKALGSKKEFAVASANAVVGVRGTVWRMSIERDQSTLVRVYEGAVEVYNPFVKADKKPEEGGFQPPREVPGPQEVPPPAEVSREQWEAIVITQMMQVTIPATGKPGNPVAFQPEEDQRQEWVRWNQRRDRDIIR